MSLGNWIEVDGNYHERTSSAGIDWELRWKLSRKNSDTNTSKWRRLTRRVHNNQSWRPTDRPKVRNEKKCIELTLLLRCARFYTIATFSLFAFIRRHRFKKWTKPFLLKSFYCKSYVQKSYLFFEISHKASSRKTSSQQHRSTYNRNKRGKRESEEKE